MLDWNGNGRIDPVDAGISISVESEQETAVEQELLQRSPSRLKNWLQKWFGKE